MPWLQMVAFAPGRSMVHYLAREVVSGKLTNGFSPGVCYRAVRLRQ